MFDLKRPRQVDSDAIQALDLIRQQNPVVHVVANGVRGDSRVIKSALTSINQGLPTLVLGITGGVEPDFFEAEGVPVLLAPFTPPGDQKPSNPLTRRSRSWKRREYEITAWRLGQAGKSRKIASISREARRTTRGRSTDEWSEPRPAWLQINTSLADVLDEIEPRLIHVHDSVPLPAAIAHVAGQRLRHRYVGVVYDAHECCPELIESFPDSPMYAALASIEAQYIHDATNVVTVSKQIAEILTQHYRLPVEPVVVTNCPDRDRDPSAPDLRSVIGLASDVPLAVYSGWVAPERGLDTVLRAMPSMPEVHLALVVNSENPELLTVLRLANTLGVLDRVHTAPYVIPSQITQYLSSADIGLIPRKSGRHLDLSLPTKFREYIQAGLPLVVSDNVAMAAEVNRTKVGRVFKAGNVGGLSLQVGRVLAEPERYTRRINAQLLDEYAWDTQAKNLREIYAPFRLKRDDSQRDLIAASFEPFAPPADDTATDDAASPGARTDATWQHAKAKYYGMNLGIGRANSASQAYAWAEALSTHVGLSAQSFAPKRAVCHRPHVAIRSSFTVEQAAVELGRVTSNYTYLLIDGYTSLFGPLMQGDLEREIDLLRPHMFGIGLVAHGSEIRDPDAHLAQVEGSYFAHASDAWVDVLRDISSRNRAIADRFDGPLFVSTPDLLQELPTAHWLPVVVDPVQWSEVPAATMGRRLRVLHQPSRSDPPIKGTDAIEPVLEQLDREGLIDYVHSSGPVDADEMPGLVAQCDVVVDQIRTGSYGVAATEAMMAGRVVVGSLSEQVRKEIGIDVPIINAPPDDFERVMRGLIDSDRGELTANALASRDYANRVHDGQRSAHIISEVLLGVKPPTEIA